MPRPRLLLAALALFTTTLAFAADTPDRKWVASWVSAQQLVEPHNLPPAPGLAGRTLRQIIQPSLAGNRLRLAFSNAYGEAPVRLTAVHVARSAGGSAIVSQTNAPLTFNGSPSVTLLPGTKMISDEIAFTVTPFDNLAVSVHVEAVPQNLTGHPGSRTGSFIAEGNLTTAPELPDSTRVERWYLLSELEVLAAPDAAAIVVIGDSITDGRGSTTDQNNRWPNLLARRLHANPATAHISVLNQGAGGGRVLRDGLGTSALGRFDRDVIAIPGVRWLIIFEGVNDLGTAVDARANGQPHATAADLIAAYQQMITRAHAHGIKVIGATIMAFAGFTSYDTPESEADRQAVNDWIRNSGAFDGVIDFDAITRDPENPARLAAAVDGGDHLHPSADGYRIMAEAIDLSLFQ
jgi:Lysophospholipase L1 and related esterases